MSDQDNVDLVTRGFEAFNNADIATLGPMFADDAVQHMPGDNILAGDHEGRDGILAMYGRIAEETGGTFRAPLEQATADGSDRVIARFRAQGERKGKSYDVMHSLTFTIKDGKFADLVDTPDDGAAFDDFWS